mgnify:CR=1 FL=1
MKPESRGVQSIEVGGRILIALSKFGTSLMLKDIAALAELPAAQVHAYLVSFRKLELVEQDERGSYQLGPMALQLGLARMKSHEPLRLASSAATQLADQMGMMVTIAVWGTHGPTIVQVTEGGDQVHVNLRAGTVYSIMGTATGKVFASYMPESLVWPYVRKEVDRVSIKDTIKTKALNAFRKEISQIKNIGYAIAMGNPIPGIHAISCPVFDHTDRMKLAVTVIGVSNKLDLQFGSKDIHTILQFTRRLSERNGYGYSKR